MLHDDDDEDKDEGERVMWECRRPSDDHSTSAWRGS